MNCEHCGNPIADDAVKCDFCGQAVQEQAPIVMDSVVIPEEKKENMVTGIVGAFIGAMIGAAVIILLGQLGYVASISGFVLAVCTLKGYELLGRKLSGKGIIICLILIVVTPYFADRISWAIDVAQYFEVPFGRAFAAMPDLISEGYIEKSAYFTGLAMIYLFAALGAFGTLRDLFKKK